MLNYLGPSFGGSGPVTNVLPPVNPGTMPSGVPGAQSLVPPVPPPQIHPAAHGHGAPSHAALAAILKHAATGGGVSLQPPHPDYGTTTQDDGSILLHLKNPDGTLGPVVKVIPPIKRGDQPQPK